MNLYPWVPLATKIVSGFKGTSARWVPRSPMCHTVSLENFVTRRHWKIWGANRKFRSQTLLFHCFTAAKERTSCLLHGCCVVSCFSMAVCLNLFGVNITLYDALSSNCVNSIFASPVSKQNAKFVPHVWWKLRQRSKEPGKMTKNLREKNMRCRSKIVGTVFGSRCYHPDSSVLWSLNLLRNFSKIHATRLKQNHRKTENMIIFLTLLLYYYIDYTTNHFVYKYNQGRTFGVSVWRHGQKCNENIIFQYITCSKSMLTFIGVFPKLVVPPNHPF